MILTAIIVFLIIFLIILFDPKTNRQIKARRVFNLELKDFQLNPEAEVRRIAFHFEPNQNWDSEIKYTDKNRLPDDISLILHE